MSELLFRWGVCQRCLQKILVYGPKWPKACPGCGYAK